jgi:hypothetical protein
MSAAFLSSQTPAQATASCRDVAMAYLRMKRGQGME